MVLVAAFKYKAMIYTMKHEDGEPVPCDSCGCEVPTGEFNWAPGSICSVEVHDRPTRALCEFCSTTMASRNTEYPTRYEVTELRAEIWKAAACVFNMLKATDK